MDIFDKIELQDCPICGGAGLLEEENGNSFYVACMDCGSRSVNIDYKEEAKREELLSSASQKCFSSSVCVLFNYPFRLSLIQNTLPADTAL